jgi:prepilin-type N-terminal cleavage/methylation domain-containing protein
MFPREASKRLCAGGCLTRFSEAMAGASRSLQISSFDCYSAVPETLTPSPSLQKYVVPTPKKLRERANAFTLLELLIVVGIIAVLLVLLAPAFTTIKSGTDVTSAAYTTKGVLDTARTYAKASNTYTWVGFYEENVSNQSSPNADQPPVGRLIMSIVASKDGTNVYGTGNGTIDPTKLIQVGKLVKIENIHLPLFAVCASNCAGDSFDTRPPLQNDPIAGYNYSRFGELNAPQPNTAPYTTPYNFQYPIGNPAPPAQYTFSKILQFSPRGESRVNGDSYDVRRVVEIGLLQTHGTATPVPVSGGGTSGVVFSGNVVAVQITGFGGNTKIYRR